jgi:hypothetical protein
MQKQKPYPFNKLDQYDLIEPDYRVSVPCLDDKVFTAMSKKKGNTALFCEMHRENPLCVACLR